MLTGYTTRKKIIIDSSLIDEDLTNFPVRVFIDSDSDVGAHTKSDGADIRFTSDDGKTELKYEIEDFTITNNVATGNFWVKVPLVSSNTDTVIYIYYGNFAVRKGEKPNDVWDDNYQMVLHMNDATSSTVTDSTSKNNDGTKVNGPIEATGKIGQAQQFDASQSQYINCGEDSSLDFTTGFTASCWMFNTYTPTSGNWNPILAKEHWNASEGWLLNYIPDSNVIRYVKGGSSGGIEIVNIFTATWYHITATNDNGSAKVYIDGVEQGNSTITINNASVPLHIGMRHNNNGTGARDPFDGQIDEVRVSDITRSPAWIKASYHSENNSLTTISPEIKKRFTKTFNGVSAKNIKTINGIDVVI
jgi:hypothetical protein